MATIKNTLETNFTSKGSQKVVKETDQIGKAQTRLGQASASAGRSFSAQSQGLGGVVGIYAGAAANVFALSAAFEALNRSAQLETIIRGTNSLARAVGSSGQEVINTLKQVTDGQLSVIEASTQANLALSAGFNVDQIEQLGEVALKASRALGRNLSDSFQRLTRGAIKLEPELLDELGIFTRIEPAVEAYALAIGKSVSQLTQFERRQAFANQVIKDGNKAFEEIDTTVRGTQESFESLITSFSDLAIGVGASVADFLKPFADFLDKDLGNQIVLLGAIGLLVFNNLKGVIAGFVVAGLGSLTTGLANLAERFQNTASAAKDFSAETRAASDAFVGQGAFVGGNASEGSALKKKLMKGELSTRDAVDLGSSKDKDSKIFKFLEAEDTYRKSIAEKEKKKIISQEQSLRLTNMSNARTAALAQTSSLVDAKLGSASKNAQRLATGLNFAANAAKKLGVGLSRAFAFLNAFIAVFVTLQFLVSAIFDIDIFEKIAGFFDKIFASSRAIKDGANQIREANLENNVVLEETLRLRREEARLQGRKFDEAAEKTTASKGSDVDAARAKVADLQASINSIVSEASDKQTEIIDFATERQTVETKRNEGLLAGIKKQATDELAKAIFSDESMRELANRGQELEDQMGEILFKLSTTKQKLTEDLALKGGFGGGGGLAAQAEALKDIYGQAYGDDVPEDKRMGNTRADFNQIMAQNRTDVGVGQINVEEQEALVNKLNEEFQSILLKQERFAQLTKQAAGESTKAEEIYKRIAKATDKINQLEAQKRGIIGSINGEIRDRLQLQKDLLAIAEKELKNERKRQASEGLVGNLTRTLKDKSGVAPDMTNTIKALGEGTLSIDIDSKDVLQATANFQGLQQVLAAVDENGALIGTEEEIKKIAKGLVSMTSAMDLMQGIQDKLNKGQISAEKATQQLNAIITSVRKGPDGAVKDFILEGVMPEGETAIAVRDLTQLAALSKTLAKGFGGAFDKLGKLFSDGKVEAATGKIARNAEEEAAFRRDNLNSLVEEEARLTAMINGPHQEQLGDASRLAELQTITLNIAKESLYNQIQLVQQTTKQVKEQEKSIKAGERELKVSQLQLGLLNAQNDVKEIQNKEAARAAQDQIDINYFKKVLELDKQRLSNAQAIVEQERELADVLEKNNKLRRDIVAAETAGANQSRQGSNALALIAAQEKNNRMARENLLEGLSLAQLNENIARLEHQFALDDITAQQRLLITKQKQDEQDIKRQKTVLIEEMNNKLAVNAAEKAILEEERKIMVFESNSQKAALEAKEKELTASRKVAELQFDIAKNQAAANYEQRLHENSILLRQFELLKAQIQHDKDSIASREDQLARAAKSQGQQFDASTMEDAASINLSNVNKLIAGIGTLNAQALELANLELKKAQAIVNAAMEAADIKGTTLAAEIDSVVEMMDLETELNNLRKAALDGLNKATVELTYKKLNGLSLEDKLNREIFDNKMAELNLEKTQLDKIFAMQQKSANYEMSVALVAIQLKTSELEKQTRAVERQTAAVREQIKGQNKLIRGGQVQLKFFEHSKTDGMKETEKITLLSRDQLSLQKRQLQASKDSLTLIKNRAARTRELLSLNQQLLSVQAQTGSIERSSAINAAQGRVASAQAGGAASAKTETAQLQNILDRTVLNEKQTIAIRMKMAKVERDAAFAGMGEKKKLIALERDNALFEIEEKQRLLAESYANTANELVLQKEILNKEITLLADEKVIADDAYNRQLAIISKEEQVIQTKAANALTQSSIDATARELEIKIDRTRMKFVLGELKRRERILDEEKKLAMIDAQTRGDVAAQAQLKDGDGEAAALKQQIAGMDKLEKGMGAFVLTSIALERAQDDLTKAIRERDINESKNKLAQIQSDKLTVDSSRDSKRTDLTEQIEQITAIGAKELEIYLEKNKNLTLESKEVRAAFDRKMAQLGIEGAAADAAYKITIERLKYQATFQAKLHELAKSLTTTLVDGLGAAIHKIFDNIAEGEKSLKEGLSDIGREVFKDIRKQTLETTVVAPFKEGVTGLISSALGVDVGKTKGIDNLTVTGEGAALVKDVDDNGPGKLKEKIQEKGMTFFDEFKTRASDVFTSMKDGIGKFGSTALDTFGGLGKSLSNLIGGEGGIMSSLSGFMQGITGGGGEGVGSTLFNMGKTALSFMGFGGPAATGGLVGMTGVRNMAAGGQVNALRDRVPAMLEPGEFVIRKPAAKSIGNRALGQMNATGAAGMGNVQFNIVNEGEPKSAEQQGQPKFDADKIVIDVVMRDLQSNGPIRNAMRNG